ncbi:MAG: DUF5518 domain-containing protein [Halobacteriales archaeon]
MAEGDTLVNAAIGGAVAIVTSVVLGPASPVTGSAATGYLQRGDTRDGAVVGAIAGAIALVPFLLFAGLFAVVGFAPVLGFFPTAPIDAMAGAPEGFTAFGGGVFLLVFLSVLVVGALVIVGSGALGGVASAYVATETDLEI